MNAEQQRLAEADSGAAEWRAWGPYLAERAWGTVREDYSADGDAWAFFPHDHARSRAYRWNEDGMAGFCDEGQDWCLALALWNGVDPILKERMFGLAGPEGNHGEDVKEYWWYLDGTPTHSWQTWRYHYPQRAFPYERPGRHERRSRPSSARVRAGGHRHLRRRPLLGGDSRLRQGRRRRTCCMRITVENAGPDPATLDVLPTLWFRNPGPGARSPNRGRRSATPRTGSWPSSPRSGRLTLVGDGLTGAAVLRQRDQPGPAVRGREHHRLPEGRHRRPRRARRGDGQPGPGRHQGGAALPADRPRR